jgi:hypothetical protein
MLIAIGTSVQCLVAIKNLRCAWKVDRNGVNFSDVFDVIIWFALALGVFLVFWDEIDGGDYLRLGVIAVVLIGVAVVFRLRDDAPRPGVDAKADTA